MCSVCVSVCVCRMLAELEFPAVGGTKQGDAARGQGLLAHGTDSVRIREVPACARDAGARGAQRHPSHKPFLQGIESRCEWGHLGADCAQMAMLARRCLLQLYGSSIFGNAPATRVGSGVTQLIADHLSVWDALRMTQTCFAWSVYLTNDQYWKRRLVRDGMPAPSSVAQLMYTSKELYRRALVANAVRVQVVGAADLPVDLTAKGFHVVRKALDWVPSDMNCSGARRLLRPASTATSHAMCGPRGWRTYAAAASSQSTSPSALMQHLLLLTRHLTFVMRSSGRSQAPC